MSGKPLQNQPQFHASCLAKDCVGDNIQINWKIYRGYACLRLPNREGKRLV
jgi:hypothetical protein